jgi:cellulose synthase (UDP-forming)
MQLKLYKKVLSILAVVLTIIYLIWRIFFTIPSYQHHEFAFVFAIALLVSEIISNFTAFILIFLRLRFNKKT